MWWHGFSHQIIEALSIDSGYSSATVRERVLVDVDSNRGGVLLHAVQLGGDGTLGDLMALATKFRRVLIEAVRDIDGCSNDPLCSEVALAPHNRNGSACHVCMLEAGSSKSSQVRIIPTSSLEKHSKAF